MAIFNTDLEAIIFITIIAIGLVLINNILNFIFRHIKQLSIKSKIIVNFSFRIISVLIVIYFIMEGIPSFQQIDPTYQAILTGSVTTAIAFASSGIFTNLVSGIILIIIRPFDVDDLVKIKGDKGIVRSINLTRTVIETFDYILIEKSNSEVISSPIINYTIKLGKIKTFKEFKNIVQSPLDRDLFLSDKKLIDDKKEYENELREVYKNLSKRETPNLYAYTFRMTFPYNKFRLIMEHVENLCKEYKNNNIFRLRPRFHIIDIGFKITVKFRILTFHSEKIFNYQSELTNDIYKIIYAQK